MDKKVVKLKLTKKAWLALSLITASGLSIGVSRVKWAPKWLASSSDS